MKAVNWTGQLYNRIRWHIMNLAGIILICAGIMTILNYRSLVFIITACTAIIIGCIFICISVQFISIDMFCDLVGNSSVNFNGKVKNGKMLKEKKLLVKGPKIVAIGGGTGLSTMLRGLKAYTSNLTAIVTVADDGGGSGVLRQDLGILPPGDIRNCIMALADTEPIMERLLQYRFKEGMLTGQSFGNLFLAAMDGISSSFEEAVRRMSDVLAVTGRVLPVTLQDIKLHAELDDGFIISGESMIGKHNDFHQGKVKRVFLEPKTIKPLKEAKEAIIDADIIIMGPGSLYTSVIPNLLVDGICDAIKESTAVKAYVCNVMTQPGETEGYTVTDHIRAIEKHSFGRIVDCCIVNNECIPDELMRKYMEDGASAVQIDYEELKNMNIEIIEGNFVSVNNNYIRHNTNKLAQTIVDVMFKSEIEKNKKNVISSFYIKDRIKRMVG